MSNRNIYPTFDGSGFRGYWTLQEFEAALPAHRTKCIEIAKESNAQHVIYASKDYGVQDSDTVVGLNFYCIPCDDQEFFKRTDKPQADHYIYAAHKGTAY